MNSELGGGLIAAYNSFKDANPQSAKEYLLRELDRTLDDPEVIFALKCAKFWVDVFARSKSFSGAFQIGDFFLMEWNDFIHFIHEDEKEFKQALYAIKQGIFRLALEKYQSLLHERDKALKCEILSRIGLCQKALGNYETAIRFFQDANAIKANSAELLAELGDCYALCGEEKTAKVLFREAFFIDPQEIDDTFLESELFLSLRRRTSEKGYDGAVLKEWLPVYGVLFGVFNVKRELRALEAGKLRQSIFGLEKELKEVRYESPLLIPRLINHYFWLIDYYVSTAGERQKVNDILLKIKLLDSDVWELYTV